MATTSSKSIPTYGEVLKNTSVLYLIGSKNYPWQASNAKFVMTIHNINDTKKAAVLSTQDFFAIEFVYTDLSSEININISGVLDFAFGDHRIYGTYIDYNSDNVDTCSLSSDDIYINTNTAELSFDIQYGVGYFIPKMGYGYAKITIL